MELLQFDNLTVVQVIQFMLAPAVMINACGLLLLSINNKYSIVVNRIRLLNDEKRKLTLTIGGSQPSTDDYVRLESIAKQISSLVYRSYLIRSAVLSYVSGIGSFVLTSLLIGILSFFSLSFSNYLIISAFLIGMLSVLTGVIFTGLEAKKGYEIILYEVKSHE